MATFLLPGNRKVYLRLKTDIATPPEFRSTENLLSSKIRDKIDLPSPSISNRNATWVITHKIYLASKSFGVYFQ
jgi:hypothetical protein